MGGAIDFSAGIGRREIDAVQRRFQMLHRDRLLRILEELRPAQQEFLHLLPLLFHVNHPMLPGFVSSETPAGIACYRPSRQQLALAKASCRSLPATRHRARFFPLDALYIMGSAGSIGHSRGSDLDVWLCHQSGIEPLVLDELNTKAQRLEARAEELGLEMHIFPMDVEEFRRGKLSRLSGDSSGSTQHGLLLEEFYRSGLLLAGRYPLWWLVPPEHEHTYAEFARDLIHRRFLNPGKYLDFGGLSAVAENEFFGAGIWHLFKGIRSPYKAVLKILLMEAYTQGFPQPDWLASKIKRSLYGGEVAVEQLDAYLLMYREVERYLLGRDQRERLELARRCLYFKVGESLSRPGRRGGWRARIMQELVRDWGWSDATLQDLDGRQRWKVERVIRERDKLVRELNRSYRLLSEFATGHGLALRVSPEELNLLGRKLYTAMEHRPGKVERVNPGISDDLSEEQLALDLHMDGGAPAWSLFRAKDGTPLGDALKISRSLVELLAWCQVNSIATAQTRFLRLPQDCPVSEGELERLLRSLRETLPPSVDLEVPLGQLAGPPWPLRAIVVVNLGEDPQRLARPDGLRLISDRSDPLSYGSERRCLLLNLELLIHTSWGELIVQRHEGAEGLMDALCYYLDLCRRTPPEGPATALRVAGFASPDGARLARRIEELMRDSGRFFRTANGGRYLVGLGSATFLLQAAERGFRWVKLDTPEELLGNLAEPRSSFSPVAVDPATLTDSPLPTVLRHCREGQQRAFYRHAQGCTDVYIADESGALFHQKLTGGEPERLLARLRQFLESMDRMRRVADLGTLPSGGWSGPAFFRLERGPEAGWQVLPARLPGLADDYLDLRLVAEKSGQEVRVLSLVCGGREFSALAYGLRLYDETARVILAHRRGGDYPIYLTDVELIQERYGIPPGGVEMLALKQRVERRLNQALRKTS